MLVKYIELPINEEHQKSVMGIGYFDGVHLGHQQLINAVKEEAKKRGLLSAIFTFDPSIDVVLGRPFYGEITPLKARLKKFEELGLDITYVFKFDINSAKLGADDFIDKILKPLNIATIICGSDFHYGYCGMGNTETLNKTIETIVIDFLMIEGRKISSTNIISMIRAGDVDHVPPFLGCYYSMECEIVHGKGNGAKLGFPTANLDYGDYVLPKTGVYSVRVTIENTIYDGVANVGCHPTIDEVAHETVEVHILEFAQDIYNQTIKVEFLRFIRPEYKFSDVKNLKTQINLDTFFNF